jgi:sec-independent protein translocase protein TatC
MATALQATRRRISTLLMTDNSQPDALVKKSPDPVEEEGGQMTFFEHLVELRKRIVHALIAIAIGAFVGVYVAKYVINFVTKPMLKALVDAHLDPKLVYTHPAGGFNLIITLGIYIGVVLASPVVLYQIWLFVAPALYKHERSAITGFLFSTVFLFLAGIAFGYFVTLPYVLKFLVTFQVVSLPGVVPMITITEYFDLTLMILLGLGLVFELPVLVFFLSIFGIVTPQFLWKNIRYAILVIAIVAAIITPTPDAMTMLIFMAPMVALYFVGIGVSALAVRKRARSLAAETAEAR